MPFRVIVVLIGEIVAAIVAVVQPYLGLLALVFLTFGRPQDDRPNITALHIPLVTAISIIVGTLLRIGSVGSILLDSVKRMWIIFVFYFLMTVSALASYTDIAMDRLSEFTTVICLCVLTLAWVRSEARLRAYIWMLLGSGAYLVYHAIRNPGYIVETIGAETFTRLSMGKTSGQFGNTNYLALFMVILIFFSISLTALQSSPWRRAGFLAFSGACAYIFFRAQSRGASLGLAAGLLCLWFTQRNKLKSAVIALVLVGLGSLLAPQQYWQRLATVGHYEEDTSATNRLKLWDEASKLISEHPVLGVGPDNFILYATNTPHNAYLQVGCELGLPALVVYVAVLFVGLRSAWRARSLASSEMQGSPYVFALSQGILASVVAIVVQGFTTGLAHREFVYVFVTLGICLQALAEAEAGRERPEQAPLEQTSLEHAV